MDGRTRIRCNFALRTGHTGGRGRCVLERKLPRAEQVFGREGESGDSESLGECRQAGSSRNTCRFFQ